MKAAVYHGARDIRIVEVPDPGEPGDREVVLEVRRVALCGTDASEWDHGPRLMKPPVISGHEFTGTVVAAGRGADGFAVGQRVVSGAGVWCDACDWCRAGRTNLCASYATHGLQLDGGLARFVRVPVKTLASVPDAVSDDAAALAQPQAVGIHAVKRSGLRAGDTVAVIGTGGIGTFIVAAAAARGAAKLIAVDVDEQRLETGRAAGATHGVNATGIDLTRALLEITGGQGADVIVEASGAPYAPSAALAAVKRGGCLALVGLQSAPRELDLFSMTIREVNLVTSLAHVCRDDLPESVSILATSNIASLVVERVIGLGDLVPQGIEPLVNRTARGKILVDPRQP